MNGDDTRTAQFALHFRLDQLQIDDAALRIATGGNFGTPRSKADIDGTQKNMLKSLDAERDPDVVIRSVKLAGEWRSEEHTSELQSLMRISYAVFCLKKKTTHKKQTYPKAYTD